MTDSAQLLNGDCLEIMAIMPASRITLEQHVVHQPSPFALPATIQQEEFSRAYIMAVAASAGYSTEKRTVDVDCVDVDIHQRDCGDIAPLIPILSIQAKCTYAHVPANGYLAFPLEVKTYNNLRLPRPNAPRILVVVHVPRESSAWLTHDPDSLTLRHNAYWCNLSGMAPTSANNNFTIRIPTQQQFTVQWLRDTMDFLAMEGRL